MCGQALNCNMKYIFLQLIDKKSMPKRTEMLIDNCLIHHITDLSTCLKYFYGEC